MSRKRENEASTARLSVHTHLSSAESASSSPVLEAALRDGGGLVADDECAMQTRSRLPRSTASDASSTTERTASTAPSAARSLRSLRRGGVAEARLRAPG